MLSQKETLQHSTRRRIMRKLLKEKAFLREIAKDLNIPTSTAAYHLKRLTQVGLLEERRGVYHAWYLLTDKGRRLAQENA
jgi:predicted transcriptional regulator